jgi:hypothetical protein
MRLNAGVKYICDLTAVGQPIGPAAADPAIRKALNAIRPQRIQNTIDKLVSFGNRSTLSSMETDLKPGTGVNAAADWIESELKSYSADCNSCLEVKRDTFTEPPGTEPNARITRPTVISNVYAVLRGTDSTQAKRIYLVTGHYDSRNSTNANTHDPAPGANDDASGVAVSLECARVLSKMKFPASLVFVAVAGEEQGLNGSRHLAQLAKSEGWQLEGVLNNDIVGGNTTPGDLLQNKHRVRVFSEGVPASSTPQQLRLLRAFGGENDSPSRELARAVSDAARAYYSAPAKNDPFRPVLEFRSDRFGRGGDHSSFNQEGFAAVRFTEWREDYNHQHQDVRVENGIQFGDLLQFVDFNYVANVARVNAATLATLASAPPPPASVVINIGKQENESELKISAQPGTPLPLRYEIVWRETSAPDWQWVKVVEGTEPTLTIKLPISKDNVIFGVRAVDATGHRSLTVTPIAER